MANSAEFARVEQFLRSKFRNPEITLGDGEESAEMTVRGRRHGAVYRVVDEGEVSYDLQMMIRSRRKMDQDDETALAISEEERDGLERHLRTTLGHQGLELVLDDNSPDSAEVSVDGEFMGVISKIQDEGATSYDLHISILDIDIA